MRFVAGSHNGKRSKCAFLQEKQLRPASVFHPRSNLTKGTVVSQCLQSAASLNAIDKATLFEAEGPPVHSPIHGDGCGHAAEASDAQWDTTQTTLWHTRGVHRHTRSAGVPQNPPRHVDSVTTAAWPAGSHESQRHESSAQCVAHGLRRCSRQSQASWKPASGSTLPHDHHIVTNSTIEMACADNVLRRRTQSRCVCVR